MNSETDQLRDEVFKCEHCIDVDDFSRPANGGPFFKFPPIIGAQGEASLLFVGINPRRSNTNYDLHDWLMQSSTAFEQLAKNVQKDGAPYIRKYGKEPHYDCHMIVVEGVFGSNAAFEAKAAVTELLLCASPQTPKILSQQRSPCAGRYLGRVIRIVKPKVVVAVGKGVLQHLEYHFRGEIPVPIVYMKHPAFLLKASWAEKLQEMQPTIDGVRQHLGLLTL